MIYATIGTLVVTGVTMFYIRDKYYQDFISRKRRDAWEDR